ncbi:RNA 3'-terminal phosphate cyclase (ATP) [Candidatus Methanophagaceae archaeon]|nr:RNA 3'-terminal phosphate cyclase (ATP) [Methanophagales archaeon]
MIEIKPVHVIQRRYSRFPAVALAAVTGEGVEITNIRANRPKPGLSAQHLQAAKAVERLSGGETDGLKLGSARLTIIPAELKGFEGEINIGTAGSITLLLQCLIPVALFAESETRVKIIGGTDVRWAPPIDFYNISSISSSILIPLLFYLFCFSFITYFCLSRLV